jgi:DNA primase
MFLLLVEQYSRRGNWRGYSYVSDMRGQALVQLSQVGLQFDESRSDNPFAWYTQIIKNCLTGSTMILTREYGSVPIEDVANQNVHLLDGDGEWVQCRIHDCGEQETVKLNFFGSWEKVAIRSTMQHGWIVDGKRVETREYVEHPYRMKDVRIDDLRPAKLIKDEEQYRCGVVHGLIYGDGSAAPRCKKFYFMRLCHPKYSLGVWLDHYPKSYAKSYNGDPTYYIAQAWCDLKAFPVNPGESLDYLLGFLRGWFAADGCVSDEGTNSVAKLTAPEPAYQWLKQWGPLVGWHVRGYSVVENRSGFISNQESLNIHLKKHSMDVEDFLHEKHRERWQQTLTIKKPKAWTIYPGTRNQDYERRVERVYCPEVETTHSFALSCGIHSGNSFRRTLLLERRNQDIRDDLLIMAGAIPSFTRQVDDEIEQRNDRSDAEPEPPKRRGRRPKARIES